ncbi:MAG: hypothetical protein CFE31_07200 [Rhizobiales bacterium PAR1]|nr:MAG: hypothetical protein CFE31_07200 [Rhizobiales bacterium PAR1]
MLDWIIKDIVSAVSWITEYDWARFMDGKSGASIVIFMIFLMIKNLRGDNAKNGACDLGVGGDSGFGDSGGDGGGD